MNLFKTGAVQRKRVETFRKENYKTTQPRIHACVFDPATGRLKKLDVDFQQYIDGLHDIYDLYGVEEAEKTKKKEEKNKRFLKSSSKEDAPRAASA